jgi:4-aminobutyrate aminotransferase-like enzyme
VFNAYRRHDVSDLVAEVVAAKAFKKGLNIAAFKVANTVKLCPPLCITEDEVDKGVDILDEVLDEIDHMTT